MATSPNKPSKRMSSLFSIGSTSSERSGASSNTSESLHPNKASRDSSPANLPQLSTDLRVSASNPDLRNERTPTKSASPGRLTPTLRPTTPIEPGNLLSQMDPVRDSSQRSMSPGGRPNSGPASRPGSRANSRTSSPTKFFRPLTPSQETKLSKRRSWLPGKTRPESHDGVGEMLRAWLLDPDQQESIKYDLAPLANFRRVGSVVLSSTQARLIGCRSPSCGTIAATPLSISIIASTLPNRLSKSTRQASLHQQSYRH